MTIADMMEACMMVDCQEFSVYDFEINDVVWEGVLDDCPYADAEFATWDLDSKGKLYFNVWKEA